VTDSRIASKLGCVTVSLQERNFSAIQGRRASGEAETAKPIVEGKVACSSAYALPIDLNSAPRSRPTSPRECRT
jgi:hypothetical protein